MTKALRLRKVGVYGFLGLGIYIQSRPTQQGLHSISYTGNLVRTGLFVVQLNPSKNIYAPLIIHPNVGIMSIEEMCVLLTESEWCACSRYKVTTMLLPKASYINFGPNFYIALCSFHYVNIQRSVPTPM